MSDTSKGIRLVALLEASKGLLVLLAGFGVLGLMHSGAQLRAEELVRHFHLNPGSRFPRIFIDVVTKANDHTLWLLACGALAYATLRLLEAVGLWRERAWAKWLGAVSGAIYIPAELYELLGGVSWPKLTLLFVNLVCVAYLVHALRTHGAHEH